MKPRAFVFAVVALLPRAVLACPVCFGNSDSPLASATNLGIMVMLGIVAAVLSGFAAFIVHLNRRARAIAEDGRNAPADGHASLPLSSPQEGNAQC